MQAGRSGLGARAVGESGGGGAQFRGGDRGGDRAGGGGITGGGARGGSGGGDALPGVAADPCELDLSDIERICVRKAFCAAQKALSDFIRAYSQHHCQDNWFEDFLSLYTVNRNIRIDMRNKGSACTWDMCVQFCPNLT
jgi:hypothetical protein